MGLLLWGSRCWAAASMACALSAVLGSRVDACRRAQTVPRTMRWEALSSASSEHFGRTHALGGIGSRLYASQKPTWIRGGCVLVSFDTLGEIEDGRLIHLKSLPSASDRQQRFVNLYRAYKRCQSALPRSKRIARCHISPLQKTATRNQSVQQARKRREVSRSDQSCSSAPTWK